MKKSKRRWLALQIAAPALILFGLSVYYYVQNYSYLYSKALLGPLATLSLIVFGAYALTLYPKTLMLLKTRSPQELRQLNWGKTVLVYIPIALSILGFVAGWLYFTRMTIQWAAGEYFSGLTGLIFVFAFLMILQEVMKILDRQKGLQDYLTSRDRHRPQLKFSASVLRFLVIAQSLVYLAVVWFGFTLVTFLVVLLSKIFLPPSLVLLGVLFLYIPVIIGFGKLELMLEKWGRDYLYIPWSSR